MAKDVKIAGATYEGVPSVVFTTASGGTARFIDEDDVVTYYTGSEPPDASLGKAGDLYFQTSG